MRIPSLLERGDRIGGSPLHRAVMGSARKVVELLLDRGADIHAFHSTSRGGGGGWWSTRVQAIDLAIWGWNNLAPSKRDFDTARLLVSRGAEFDLTVASALGDIGRVTAILDEDPSAIRHARANGRRPLTAAVEFGHHTIVRLLLDRGADPNMAGAWRANEARRYASPSTARRSRPGRVTARSWRGSQQRCRTREAVRRWQHRRRCVRCSWRTAANSILMIPSG